MIIFKREIGRGGGLIILETLQEVVTAERVDKLDKLDPGTSLQKKNEIFHYRFLQLV